MAQERKNCETERTKMATKNQMTTDESTNSVESVVILFNYALENYLPKPAYLRGASFATGVSG